MKSEVALQSFLKTVQDNIEPDKKEYVTYLEKAILDFLKNNSADNADLVYTYFMGLYRMTDSEGGPLIDMIDVMHSYEIQASTFTEKHRDHYIHSVNVFLLGIQIYQSSPKIRNAFTDVYGKGTFATPELSFMFTWGNAALFHDVGYPIEIASNQAKRFVRMISSIDGREKKTDVGIQIDPLTDLLSLDTSSWDKGSNDILGLLSNGINRTLHNNPDAVNQLIRNHLNNMFEHRYVDHGFFSAVITLRCYAYAMQRSNESIDRFVGEVECAASAILMHNLYPYSLARDERFGPLKVESHPTGYLLMLSDILQEWNRKGYGLRNLGAPYPKSSDITVNEDVLRVTYQSVDGYLPPNFGKEKEKKLRSCIDLDSVFPGGFHITCSCDNSADVLLNSLDSDYKNVPRPILDSVLEMAKAIHELYNRDRLEEKPGEPLEYPDWDSLPQDLKYSNMAQVLDYVNKLSSQGYYIGTEGTPVTSFSDREVEAMAIMEHDRWVNERVTNGWIYGKEKNVAERISPYIAPWEEIPENIREYDREAVRNMFSVIGGIGLKILRK